MKPALVSVKSGLATLFSERFAALSAQNCNLPGYGLYSGCQLKHNRTSSCGDDSAGYPPPSIMWNNYLDAGMTLALWERCGSTIHQPRPV
jgi:hypothetical protein